MPRKETSLTRGTSVATLPPRLTTSRYSRMVIWMVRKIVLHLTMESGRPPSDARPVSESERIRSLVFFWRNTETNLPNCRINDW